MKIVLTGFMGTGKTSVGKELGKKLGYKFIDTDVLIEVRKEADFSDLQGKGGRLLPKDRTGCCQRGITYEHHRDRNRGRGHKEYK